MYKKSIATHQRSMFFDFADQLNPKNPLYQLANKIHWDVFEEEFKRLYCEDNGAPCKPIRLMKGLLILKHLRNLSDESVVAQWEENVYYQYFCGGEELRVGQPCTPSELTHFRNRIGEGGVELILKESISVNEEYRNKNDRNKPAFIDSTVQEKNTTYPTDAKLTKKIIKKCTALSSSLGLPMRQSYKRTLKALSRDQRFRNHPENGKKALRADKKAKTIAGRLVRELERNLEKTGRLEQYADRIALYKRVLARKREDKDKIYSLHEPEVCCISKGKEHKKYEFGNKASIIRTWDGVIIGACSFRDEYDGHTIDKSLEQSERLTGRRVKALAGDRGYRGRKRSGETRILIPDTPKAADSRYERKKKHDLFCKRAGIEPVIGHVKMDHRMGRNFYKGLRGDAINIMLAAAAKNFKRVMNILFCLFFLLLYGKETEWMRYSLPILTGTSHRNGNAKSGF